jgi:hypothetical protein
MTEPYAYLPERFRWLASVVSYCHLKMEDCPEHSRGAVDINRLVHEALIAWNSERETLIQLAEIAKGINAETTEEG